MVNIKKETDLLKNTEKKEVIIIKLKEKENNTMMNIVTTTTNTKKTNNKIIIFMKIKKMEVTMRNITNKIEFTLTLLAKINLKEKRNIHKEEEEVIKNTTTKEKIMEAMNMMTVIIKTTEIISLIIKKEMKIDIIMIEMMNMNIAAKIESTELSRVILDTSLEQTTKKVENKTQNDKMKNMRR